MKKITYALLFQIAFMQIVSPSDKLVQQPTASSSMTPVAQLTFANGETHQLSDKEITTLGSSFIQAIKENTSFKVEKTDHGLPIIEMMGDKASFEHLYALIESKNIADYSYEELQWLLEIAQYLVINPSKIIPISSHILKKNAAWLQALHENLDGHYIEQSLPYTLKELLIKFKKPSKADFNYGCNKFHATAITCSPDGKTVVNGTKNGCIIVHQASEAGEWLTEETPFSGLHDSLSDPSTGRHLESIQSIAITDDASMIISGSCDHTIGIWHKNAGEWELHQRLGDLFNQNESIGHTSTISSIVHTPSANMIISASHDNTLIVWKKEGTHWTMHQRLGSSQNHDPMGGHISAIVSLAHAKENNMLISGSQDGIIIVWKKNKDGLYEMAERFAAADANSSPYVLNAIACTANGSTLFTCDNSSGKAIRVWQKNALSGSWDLIQELHGKNYDICCPEITTIHHACRLLCSDDGSMVISKSTQHDIACCIWKKNSEKEWELTQCADQYNQRDFKENIFIKDTLASSITCTPDGKTVITGLTNGALLLWQHAIIMQESAISKTTSSASSSADL